MIGARMAGLILQVLQYSLTAPSEGMDPFENKILSSPSGNRWRGWATRVFTSRYLPV